MPTQSANDISFILSLAIFVTAGGFFLAILGVTLFRSTRLPAQPLPSGTAIPVALPVVELPDRVDSGEILLAINQARVDEGMPELLVNETLNKAARAKVLDMCDRQYWSHNGPDGTQPWFWFQHMEYAYTRAGENLGKNYRTSQELIDAWLASPSHRQNIMSQNYSETGIASLPCEFEGEMTEIVVQFFAQPALAQ